MPKGVLSGLIWGGVISLLILVVVSLVSPKRGNLDTQTDQVDSEPPITLGETQSDPVAENQEAEPASAENTTTTEENTQAEIVSSDTPEEVSEPETPAVEEETRAEPSPEPEAEAPVVVAETPAPAPLTTPEEANSTTLPTPEAETPPETNTAPAPTTPAEPEDPPSPDDAAAVTEAEEDTAENDTTPTRRFPGMPVPASERPSLAEAVAENSPSEQEQAPETPRETTETTPDNTEVDAEIPAPTPEPETPTIVEAETPEVTPEPEVIAEPEPPEVVVELEPETTPSPAPKPEPEPEEIAPPAEPAEVATETDVTPEDPVTETPERIVAEAPEVVTEMPSGVGQTSTVPSVGFSNLTPPPGVRVNQLPSIGASVDAPEEDAAEENGSVEEIDPATLPALERYAVAFENENAKPLFSVILIDLEENEGGLDVSTLKDFPFPVTFAIPANRADAFEKAQSYRDAGFEVAMIASGIPQSAGPADIETAFSIYNRTIPEAVAVLDDQTASFRGNRQQFAQVTEILSETGQGLLTFDRGLNAAQQLSARTGIPVATVFQDIDSDGQNEGTLRRTLDRAAFKAAHEGHVILLGRTRQETVSTLFSWALEGRAEGVALAPISATIRALQ